jgi:hypothetical protein
MKEYRDKLMKEYRDTLMKEYMVLRVADEGNDEGRLMMELMKELMKQVDEGIDEGIQGGSKESVFSIILIGQRNRTRSFRFGKLYHQQMMSSCVREGVALPRLFKLSTVLD